MLSMKGSEFISWSGKESAQIFFSLTFPSGEKNRTFGQKYIT